MSILVIDLGTSGVRAAVVRPDASIDSVHYRQVLPTSPLPNFVEFDAEALAAAAIDVAQRSLADGGPVRAVAIANQRASTVVWDAATGRPVGPGVGWQDLRTVGMCLMLRAQGVRVAPNASATKAAFLLTLVERGRWEDLRFGTIDTWITWHLSRGALHVTDATNAGVTGLVESDGQRWSAAMLEALDLPPSLLPEIIDSSGVVGRATALSGAPPIGGIAGDQQASLLGQGCVRPGMTKITFGTGGMLDVCVGRRPAFSVRGEAGCFPVIAWRRGGELTWGIEGIMLAAGTNVEWLRDDLAVIADAAESHTVAARCTDSGDVWYVPALVGLGAPEWDFGARGTFLGLTRGTGRPELVRAVLEGVAHRGADLVEAAEADGELAIETVRIDGGMSANPTFVQAFADATGRPVEVSPVLEATTLGAAFLAGLAVGTWGGLDDIAATWRPEVGYEPKRRTDRDRWREAVERAKGWLPDLSALEF